MSRQLSWEPYLYSTEMYASVYVQLPGWAPFQSLPAECFLGNQLPYCFAFTSKIIHRMAFWSLSKISKIIFCEGACPKILGRSSLALSALWFMQPVNFCLTYWEPCVLLCDNWRMLWPDLPLGSGADSALNLLSDNFGFVKTRNWPKTNQEQLGRVFQSWLKITQG